jgi:GxxExxY protein
VNPVVSETNLKHSVLTRSIIGAFFTVRRTLGHGFLEKVYENALALELRGLGHVVGQQVQVPVWYRGQRVGVYYADVVVDDTVVLELKSCESLRREHAAQLINYLNAPDLEVGLLLNFGSGGEVKRLLRSPRSGEQCNRPPLSARSA